MYAEPFQLKHPFRALISGSSGVGKSTFIQGVLRHLDSLCEPVPQRLYYTYYFEQPWFEDFPQVKFLHALLPKDVDPDYRNLIICDDLCTNKHVLSELCGWFTRGSHHQNTSIIFVTQALFLPYSEYRLISQNADTFFLFSMPRGAHYLETFARQVYGASGFKDFVNCYKSSMAEPYAYIVLDFSPTQRHRIRSHILPNEQPERVYILDNESPTFLARPSQSGAG
jgi:hypothetical protein